MDDLIDYLVFEGERIQAELDVYEATHSEPDRLAVLEQRRFARQAWLKTGREMPSELRFDE
jgi:hypothetical protein